MNRQVVLVDEQDNELGHADIFAAHQGSGIKHRALSVILYRKKKGETELLHQKRSESKPVFKGLWSNTCCTNLRPGDMYLPRAVSRLQEEMGIVVEEKDLRELYKFSYEVADENRAGWCENELDTVLVGEWDGEVKVNPEEASDFKWISIDELQKDIEVNSKNYSPWHKMIVSNTKFIEVIHDK